MVAFHALQLQKKISMPLVLQVVQQSVFQLQHPASDWYKLCTDIFCPLPSIPSIALMFQHKFLNGVWKLIRNSETGYDYSFKNNRPLFSLLLLDFCNLKIPQQGIEMQIFFLNGLWRFLKNGHLPVKLHSSAPPALNQVSKRRISQMIYQPKSKSKMADFDTLPLCFSISNSSQMHTYYCKNLVTGYSLYLVKKSIPDRYQFSNWVYFYPCLVGLGLTSSEIHV